MVDCAPAVSKGRKLASCFSKQDLETLVSDYNSANPTRSIKLLPTATKEEMWRDLREALADKCRDKESCWIEQKFASPDRKTLERRFMPKGPKNTVEWLSTSNLDEVMRRYEDLYDDFAYIDTLPRDYAKIDSILGKINYKKARSKGIKRFAVCFNTDTSYSGIGGIHWVCWFLNLKDEPYTSEYFDSTGRAPEHELATFVNQFPLEFMKEYGIKLEKLVNTTPHQHGSHECGVYCLFFITRRLEGVSFKTIAANRISDDDVEQYRKVFFRE